ncbi:MAG: hypothetical protein PHU06_04885 [Gallionella sp.]|nr:hypothetical protein [Gallionella sp.]MDD4958881.1 hypothetical protein [Gallionella sp.]
MTDHDTTTAKPERNWVWWCNEDSIAAGKISALAILETFAAVGVWWWLAMHFNWSVLSFVALFAAPMLLLRSEASIQEGVDRLGRYWNRDENSVSKTKRILIAIFIFLITGGLIYWLASHRWTTHTSWGLLWPAAMFGAVAVVIAGVSASESAVAFARTVAFASPNGSAGTILFGQIIALGIVLRSQLIRVLATVHHPLSGLARLPQNWRETLWVIDLSHPPELIPQAGAVDDLFAVKSLWQVLRTKEATDDRLFAAILLPIFYLPALTYRWSLKASAWLWFPLILLLKPPFYGLDSVGRARQIGRSISGSWRLLPVVALGIGVWLIINLFPQLNFILNALPEKWGDFVKGVGEFLPPLQVGGIRYVALWEFCVLGLFYWWDAQNYKTDEESCEKCTDENEKKQFTQELAQLARDVERTRIFLIVMFFVWGEATVAYLLYTNNPTSAEHLISPWLLRIL